MVDVLHDLDSLTKEQLLDLLRSIEQLLRKRNGSEPQRGSLSTLYGLGAEIWEGVDPIEYQREERSTWRE